MTLIALVLSLSVAAFGAVGVISPGRLLAMLKWFESISGLIVAAVFRIALGLSLIFSAHASHSPEVIRGLGSVILAMGLILPFIGIRRLRSIIAWWSSHGLVFIRVWSGANLSLGLFLIYAVVT